MKYEDINEVIEVIKKMLLKEYEEIDIQEIEDFIISRIEKNRKLREESEEAFVKEYLEKERDALENLLHNWKRYVISLIIKGENTKIKISPESKIEKIFKDFEYYFQIDNKKGVIGIVKEKIPSFRGSDQLEYGPFLKGDIVLINKKDYVKLKERGLIEVIKFDV